MRNLRLILPSVALAALTLSGCFITSGQIFAKFALSNPFTIGPPPATPFRRELVDLNTIGDYADHKDKLNGLSDLAVVGKFTTEIGTGGELEIWITAGNTDLTQGQIATQATKLWGPKSIGGAGTPAGTVTIDWNESATLFDPAGKALLIQEILGGGVFTAYIISSGPAGQTFKVDDGAIILVINAGI